MFSILRKIHLSGRLLLLVSLALTACSDSGTESATPDTKDSVAESAAMLPDTDWPVHGHTSNEERFAPLAQIDSTNVSRLGLAWYHEFDTSRGQEATPLVVDGVIYTTTAWSKVAALDARSGKLLWFYDPQVPGERGLHACCDVVNRGAAYADGRVFVGTVDGRLIALDAKTGALLWSTLTVDQSRPYTITGAPRVAKGKVFIGNGGAEVGVRGYVSAYDAVSGELAWRFYTVPGDPAVQDGVASDAIIEKLARATWFGDKYWKYGGGGTVWDAIVYDKELDQLYIGTGNGSPWNRRLRSEDKGDNLFVSSIVALNPDTGAYIWHYQETPGETWDYTATQQITLTDLLIDGKQRKVLMHAPKNGFFYLIDRTDGALISAEKFAPVNWASHVDLASGRPVETEGARYIGKPFLSSSGASGAHNWHPMSWSAQTGLVYLPAQQVPFYYIDDSEFSYRPGGWNLGISMMTTPPPATAGEVAAAKAALKGWLLAWDPVAQKEVWRVDHAGTWNGGVLATAGNLVFQGDAEGRFGAYDARDGQRLWSFDTQTPILAGAISYALDGVQYVALMAGNGGGFALTLPSYDGPRKFPNGRLLVFRLDGDAALPPLEAELPPLQISSESWNEQTVARGDALFGLHCAGCHGIATLAAGVLPDLKRSPRILDGRAWKSVVIDGVLQQRGMANFAQVIGDEEAESIRAYVNQRARQTAGQ